MVKLQHAVADVREAWRKAGEQEVARRREEREGRALRKGALWKWLSANREADRAKGKIWSVWVRHRARADWRERMENRREAGRRAAEGGEEESDSRRTEAWQGRQDSVHTRGELRGDRRGGAREGTIKESIKLAAKELVPLDEIVVGNGRFVVLLPRTKKALDALATLRLQRPHERLIVSKRWTIWWPIAWRYPVRHFSSRRRLSRRLSRRLGRRLSRKLSRRRCRCCCCCC